MAGVAVEVVVVAAVGFVDDDDDVAAVGEEGVFGSGGAFGVGASEFLEGGEVDAAGGAVANFVAQLGAAFDLLGLFGEQHALVERLEELAVEFGAVGDDDDGGVFEFGVAGDEVGVELHFHGFAGALGVPHDASFSVGFDSEYGAADCFGDGEVLVWFGDAFGEAVTVFVERGVVAQQLQEAVLVVEAVDGVFEAGDGFAIDGAVGVDGFAVVVDVPGGEVVEGCEGGAVFGVDSVAGEGEDAVAECEGEFA